MEWEVRLIEWLQSNFGSLSLVPVKILAFIGDEKGLMLAVFIVMFCWNKETGQKLAMIIASTNAWLSMAKAVVLRPRPYMQYPDRVEPLALVDSKAGAGDVAAQGYSFPSMHSASVPALYFTLAQEVKKKWMWITASVLTILVGISRSVAGMHYPTDVLAGWALGFLIIGIFALLEKYIRVELIRYLVILASMLPGVFFVRTHDYFTSLGAAIGVAVAIFFEHRYVGYKNTQNKLEMVLRTVGAFAVYLVLNTLLKLPFDKEFLESVSLGSFMVRTARYAVVMFVIVGVYPKVFPLFEKTGRD